MNLPVQSLDDIVSSDLHTVFTREISVGLVFSNTILSFFGILFQLYRKHIAVKVASAPLALNLIEHFCYGFLYANTLVSNHQLPPIQVTATDPQNEAEPASLISFHILSYV